ncbi:hypothetical protein ABTB34_20810, partial [Acinetobacter baumannii]
GKARRLLAEQCAETILGWLQAADRGEFGLLAPDTGGDDAGGAALCPVGPGDIAALVRKGSEARVLRQALQARGKSAAITLTVSEANSVGTTLMGQAGND